MYECKGRKVDLGLGSGTRSVGSAGVWRCKESVFYGLSIAMQKYR